MKILLVALLLALASLIYYGVGFYQKFSVAQKLIGKAVPYESDSQSGAQTMLVLGDSTAVGVGADSALDTLPALLSDEYGAAEVENRAISGSRTTDLYEQIDSARSDEYGLILIMIGANDIIRFADSASTAAELEEALKTLPKHEGLVVLLSAGNLGGVKLFPWFIRPWHARLNQEYHKTFEQVVKRAGGQYVNLYEDPQNDPFVQNPAAYLAADGLHPSSKGYEVWFDKVLEQINF